MMATLGCMALALLVAMGFAGIVVWGGHIVALRRVRLVYLLGVTGPLTAMQLLELGGDAFTRRTLYDDLAFLLERRIVMVDDAADILRRGPPRAPLRYRLAHMREYGGRHHEA